MDSIFSPYLERIEQEIDIALPKKQGSEWASFAFGTEFDGVTDGHWQPLVEPTRELISLGGSAGGRFFLCCVPKRVPKTVRLRIRRTA